MYRNFGIIPKMESENRSRRTLLEKGLVIAFAIFAVLAAMRILW
ncbi:MAG: hypothetical protein UY83_C0007G0030 [Candidatus Adlerbacteria bacterium GW2011_GWA1_54_10]|uniref:Uncharacterized protein n=2 Tax=Candidatus Adleribacteriota TaxID=1752736 RepID=A0A0G1XWZ0_9BACT|nr:MAG: hypothetical protein UY83_C0007G0030 [Candidatus Adlerbacteria bacterium GW2011_GWA1_54_10]KKW38097.1 MAG: hypothetical protein UY86_C0001G0070 [Candidatus Adlerbacteria bacterium GW2011_GWB1_54_7]